MCNVECGVWSVECEIHISHVAIIYSFLLQVGIIFKEFISPQFVGDFFLV
jgi:hypothetical protein